ncbi:hypothetical protein N431DRAFT_337065 [Stipitochalara longipes BDJ]|nr:hypothetical protein N431DRAFT_337065 [Stipitochalara longipes BDJ]
MSVDISLRDADWAYVFEKVSIDSKAISSALKTKTAGDAVLEKIADADSKAISALKTKTAGDDVLEKIADADSKAISALKTKTAGDDVLEKIAGVSSEPIEQMLTGHDSDPLRPTTDQINYTFLRGKRVWRDYLTHARSSPLCLVREGWRAPYTLLQDIPPLPQDLPRLRFITGQALWHVPRPELAMDQVTDEVQDEDWIPEHVYNSQKEFSLAIEKPVECRVRSRQCNSGEEPNSTAILTLCYAYLFTARFLEMQRRPIQYSSTRLTPMFLGAFKPQPGDIVVCLRSASRHLIRWLCALLAPGLGWTIKGPLPPWAAHYDKATRFVITTDLPFNFLDNERPPSSVEATELLIEFCRLFDFQSPSAYGKSLSGSLPQPTAGFLAAFMLPFYSELKLQPQLPMPKLVPSLNTYSEPLDYLRRYTQDLQYFMTLSISPASVGSVIWSIFWESGLECNLVSAWFGSILEVIRPVIETGNTEMLSDMFTLRRERAGLLWRAIFDLGDLKVLDMIISYLESHEERSGGSFAGPDIDVAAWTGSPQSFLDEEFLGTYQGKEAQIPRSDLMRHRFNFRLGYPDFIRFGWQPFGFVEKKEIEPELWPSLELGRPREYKHWVWWLKNKENQMIAKIQPGFRQGKAKNIEVDTIHPDNSEIAIPNGLVCKVGLIPSFEATWSTLHCGARDSSGDRSLGVILINGIREHPWFAGSRGS